MGPSSGSRPDYPTPGKTGSRPACGTRRTLSAARPLTVPREPGPASRLVDAFVREFGASPAFRIRAPGRVNLIGEHIDYNGLSVLPMALPRAVHLWVRPREDGKVRIHNLDPRFGTRRFALSSDIAPYPAGDWGNYAKAAGELLAREHGATRGVDALTTSEVPVAAGLSSSSALVVACGLSFAAANGIRLDTMAMGECMARAERYVGTEGGGMDQAISLGAVEGCASRIDFGPLSLVPVPVPGDWRFVIASSLVEAEKSGASQAAYNRRTEECAEALDRVVAGLGSDVVVGPVGRAGSGARPTYRDLIRHVPAETLLRVASEGLPPVLERRFRHVVTEAARVTGAESAMRAGYIAEFGRLMSASHASLRDDYEVSHEALDRLVSICMEAGAAGARLTGAGFGGCVVALTDDRSVEGLMRALDEEFYQAGGTTADPDEHLFEARPSEGASVRPL